MSVLEFDQVDVDHATGREPAVGAVSGPSGRLAELEQVVEQGVAQAAAAFVTVGLALAELRRDRLYLVVASSWTGYVRRRFGMSQQQASALEAAARCYRAISDAGLPLPANVTVSALQPLSPILTRGGEQAVADAWSEVSRELGGATVTGPAVRTALARRGAITTAPRRAGRVQVEPIETSVTRALARARGLAAEHEGRVPPAEVRARCERLAGLARELAGVLEGIADVDTALSRLHAIEHPAGAGFGVDPDDPAGELCVGHGRIRDERGVCVGCGRADRPRAA